MDINAMWVHENKIKRTIKSLEKNNMNGYLVQDEGELLAKIKELVPEKSLVGCGGSQSLMETGVIDFIRNGDYDFLDRYKDGLTPDEMKNLHRKAFCSDVYLTSTNAITEDGELYNVDGNGNRIAAMLFGPDKVIVVCGVNKIVKDIDEAVQRNQRLAAPANAKRLNTNTPCREVGYCMNCNSPQRICCKYSVIKMQRTPGRIHVIFLNQALGY